MADILRFARRSVAKAIQKTVSSTGIEGLLDEIPNCFPLTQVNKLSIKLQDEDLHQTVVKAHILSGHFEFPPITFLIRDELSEKRTVMTASLICSRGFLVSVDGRDVMEVAIPSKSTGSLGKIAHPSGATIFKVNVAGTGKFRVQKVSSQNSGSAYMSIEKEAKPTYQLANMSGLLFQDGVYWLKRADGRVIGKVRPKFVLHQNTLILQFEDSSADSQLKAVMLGVALLLILSDAYPELSNVLKDSMNAQF